MTMPGAATGRAGAARRVGAAGLAVRRVGAATPLWMRLVAAVLALGMISMVAREQGRFELSHRSALVRKDAVMLHDPMGSHKRATVAGAVLAAVGIIGFLVTFMGISGIILWPGWRKLLSRLARAGSAESEHGGGDAGER